MPKAKNLKYLRKKADLTQQKLADKIGVSKVTIGSWENKKTAIPAPSAKAIAEFFGVDYSEFCDIDMELTEQREAPHLTESETRNLILYRQLPENVKELIRNAIQVEYENNIEKKGDV